MIKALAIAGVIIVLVLGFLVMRGRSSARSDAPMMMELRDQLLRSSPRELGVTPSAGEPYVAVMDVAYPNAVISVVTASTGDASIYFSTGGGVIGGVGHEAVRSAATSFVEATGRDGKLLNESTDLGFPSVGRVQFISRNADGLRSATAPENELAAGNHPLSALYSKGQDVITQLRLATENK